MGGVEYIHEVRDVGRLVNYMYGVLDRSTLVIDTNIVPSLESLLKQAVPSDRVMQSYVLFMQAFNDWLENYNSLVIVPGVREELTYSFDRALKYVPRNGKATRQMKTYAESVETSKRLLAENPHFEEHRGYDPLLTLLRELHPYVYWQKEEHQPGNADDQIVVASIMYGLNGHKKVNIFSNDHGLLKTVQSFYKLLTCKKAESPQSRQALKRLRRTDISLNTFRTEKGGFAYHWSTRDFKHPYPYNLMEETQVFGKGTATDSSICHSKLTQLQEKVRKFLEVQNSLLNNNEPPPEIDAGSRGDQLSASVADRLRHRSEQLPELDLSPREPPKTNGEMKLDDAVKHLMERLAPAEAGDGVDEQLQKDYEALACILKTPPNSRQYQRVQEEIDRISKRRVALTQIQAVKKQLEQCSSGITSIDGAKRLADLARQLQGLYAEVDGKKE